MKIFILFLILNSALVCASNRKEFKNIINYYKKNTIYKKCIVNNEMEKILKKEKLIPIFKIENYFCYSIWLTLNPENNKITIYYSIIKKLLDIYPTSRKFIVNNKSLNIVKIKHTKYIVRETKLTKEKKYYNVEHIRNGKLIIYKKELNKEKSKKLNELILSINKELYRCRTNYDDEKYLDTIFYINIKKLNLNEFYFTYSISKTEKDFYEDKNCYSLKNVVDYIFQITKDNSYNSKKLNAEISKYFKTGLIKFLNFYKKYVVKNGAE